MGFGQEYQKSGVKTFYSKIGKDYYNPHENDVKTLIKSIYNPNHSYLDLAAGDGIVSQALIQLGCERVEGCDPFLYDLFKQNTNLNCLKYSFEDIAKGQLQKKYDVVICSYAMHLVDPSYLHNLLYYLSTISETMVILTPHKRPYINNFWELDKSFTLGKTKMKIYQRLTK
jgi:2-polyprenyl-3-methyl-5-hydroxy-6-metoxy-1,4-benzoquinol methylase